MASKVHNLNSYEDEIAALMADAAKAVLCDGRASLDVRPSPPGSAAPTKITLTPARPDASPLSVSIEAPGEVILALGRHGTRYEVYERRRPDRVAREIENVVSSVVAGRYQEWVRGDNGIRLRVGELEIEGKRRRIQSNVILPCRLRARGFEHIRYAAY